MNVVALEHYLAPLSPFLEDETVTEVCINQPQEVFVEAGGVFKRYEVEELEYAWLESLAVLIAEKNNKHYPSPFIGGELLNGERVQIVMNPACEAGRIVVAIRRHRRKQMSLGDYAKFGAFDCQSKSGHPKEEATVSLREILAEHGTEALLTEAVKQKKNIIICGGTGTGKTTFLNSCLLLIPEQERILTVEDTREVHVGQKNAAHLLFDDNDKRITAQEVFKACLRLRPDRILLSELRGKEVLPYLRAANSGHPGSLTTVHADSSEAVFMQMMFMMQEANVTSREEQILQYIKSIIHVVVHLKRNKAPGDGRFVYVDDVWIGENRSENSA